MGEAFHFVRVGGEDTGVDAIDGPAIGVDLATLVKDGLPPVNVAMEIIAALCEILDIADEDAEFHGDIDLSSVFIDETGAVSIEGFGVERSSTQAPEDESDGALTDLYGLGLCCYSLLATRHDLEDLDSGDPDSHDDGVIEAIIAVNFEDFPQDMVGDIQWYMAKLLSFDMEERPAAVDVWRTFIAFCSELPGISLAEWGEAAIEGTADVRDKASSSKKAEIPPDLEELGGVKKASGPMSSGAINFGGGAAISGQATAFWSVDAMKAALKEEDEVEEQAAHRPTAGGGAATAFWSIDQLKAMDEGADSAPKPKRNSAVGRRGGEKPAPKQKAKPITAAPPTPTPVVSQVSAPVSPPYPNVRSPNPEESLSSSTKKPLLIAGVGLALMLLCGGGLTGLGGLYFMSQGGEEKAVVQAADTGAPPTKKAPKKEETKKEEVEEKEALVEPPKPAVVEKPKRVRKKRKPKSKPKPKGPATIHFLVPGTGTLTCNQNSVQVTKKKTLTFEGWQMPVTCMLDTPEGMWAGLVNKSGTVRCEGVSGGLSCTAP